MVRTQTDPVSAKTIASYLINWPQNIRYGPNQQAPDDSLWLGTRQHVGFTGMLIKQKTQLTNQLEKLLYGHLSELLIYCRHGIPGWLLRLLARYPTRGHLLRAGADKVATIRGISPAKARSLLGKLDPQAPDSSTSMARTIGKTARQAIHLAQLIETEQGWLVEQFKDHPDVQLVASIKGVGIASAVRLIVEIEDISRFDSIKALCAYFGVHPTWKKSGDGIWYQGMSKKGRSAVRAILFMCSLSAIRCNPHLSTLYHRFRSKGMNHYQAMGVVMHKLLRIVYGILKTQTPYDPKIDQANQQHAAQKREEIARKEASGSQRRKTRRQRFNTSDESNQSEQPPISRRAWQKRKQEASQSSLKEEYAGSPPAD